MIVHRLKFSYGLSALHLTDT